MTIVLINYELDANKALPERVRALLYTTPLEIKGVDAHPIDGQGAQKVYFAACRDADTACAFAKALAEFDGQDAISVLADPDTGEGHFILRDGKPSDTWSGYTWARSEFKSPV